jgi:hypothetical protein
MKWVLQWNANRTDPCQTGVLAQRAEPLAAASSAEQLKLLHVSSCPGYLKFQPWVSYS